MYPTSKPEYPPPATGVPQYPTQGGYASVEWSTGLCACCDDPGLCCLTYCCPCITLGRIAEVVDRGATSCAIGALVYYVLASVRCPCIYSCGYRTKIRSMYSLKEAPCGDCLTHCFCGYCAFCQEYRELKIRGVDPAIGWQGNVDKWNRAGSTMPHGVVNGMNR